jgi:hypothetical protein
MTALEQAIQDIDRPQLAETGGQSFSHSIALLPGIVCPIKSQLIQLNDGRKSRR